MKNKIEFFKKVLFYFKPFRWVFLTIIILSFIQNSISNFASYFLGKIVDSLNQNYLNGILFFTAVFLICRAIPILIGRFLDYYQQKKTDYGIFHHIGRTTLSKSLDLSLGQLKKEHSGVKQDAISNGENALNTLHYVALDQIVPLASSLVVALFGLTFININFLYISLIFLVLYFSYNSYVVSKMKEAIQRNIEFRKEKTKVYSDILRNLFFIKFSGQKDFAVKQLKKYQDQNENHGILMWTNYSKKMIVSDITLILFFSVTVIYTVMQIKGGFITIGMFIPIVSWMTQLSNSIGQLRGVQRRISIATADLNKMFAMLEQKPDIHIAEDPMRIKNFEDKIKFENVSFDYTDGKKGAMKDVNLEIKKGGKVALVGKSGSGKSTIVSLLLRLYDPTDGSILVDGIDLSAISVEDWHNLISYVPQDGDLIDLSIRENVLFGANGKSSSEKVENALKQAEAYDFVMKLPHGIETKVGERGVKLSGGQKQRICIARALVKDSPILILDEATSSLDSETEQFLNKNIWDILENKTGIVIAHRLSTILDANKIVVIDDGKIIGVGKHKKLLKECPFYKNLVDAQNISF